MWNRHAVFPTYVSGYTKPGRESKGETECVVIRVVSFKCSLEQSTLQGEAYPWIFGFRDVLQALGQHYPNDFVFCSGIGDAGKGLGKANVRHEHIVNDALRSSRCSTQGEYLSVWNIQQDAALVVDSGWWSTTLALAEKRRCAGRPLS